MSNFTVDGRVIGLGQPTLVIAEIGVNHDGSASKALELVRIAQSSGADAVKLQFFRATSLLHPSCTLAGYQRQQLGGEQPLDMLRRYELSGDDITKVVKAIRDLRMMPLATPFSPTDMELIERLRLPAVKIASPDLVNRPLLAAALRSNRPMILSTGAATMQEVRTTSGWMSEARASYALMHCISSYPVPPHQANLSWISELARNFDVPIGYSDHTTSATSGALAAAAGAVIVERHLTYDRAAKGPDHAASSDPQQFERYVRLIREADVLRGMPGKRVLDIEQDVRQVSRQSLVLRRTVRAGERIKDSDLTVQRPGTGISAALLDDLIGRRVARNLTAGSLLQWDMFEALSDAA